MSEEEKIPGEPSIEYVIRYTVPGKDQPLSFGVVVSDDMSAAILASTIFTQLFPRVYGFDVWTKDGKRRIASANVMGVLATVGKKLEEELKVHGAFKVYPMSPKGRIADLLGGKEK